MMDYEALSKEYVLHAVQRPVSLILERAEGARMWDIHGKLYLDTMSGSAGPGDGGTCASRGSRGGSAANGQAALRQSAAESPTVIEFCAKMAAVAPRGMTKTFLCTGGGEAVEAALKFAIRVTGRSEVLSLTGRLPRPIAGDHGPGRHAGLPQKASRRDALAEFPPDPFCGHLPAVVRRGSG